SLRAQVLAAPARLEADPPAEPLAARDHARRPLATHVPGTAEPRAALWARLRLGGERLRRLRAPAGHRRARVGGPARPDAEAFDARLADRRRDGRPERGARRLRDRQDD